MKKYLLSRIIDGINSDCNDHREIIYCEDSDLVVQTSRQDSSGNYYGSWRFILDNLKYLL